MRSRDFVMWTSFTSLITERRSALTLRYQQSECVCACVHMCVCVHKHVSLQIEMETSLNQHVCHFMRVQCLFEYESFKSPYLSVCVCVCSHSSRWPVLWLCHSVLPAVCPPSQPAWLQAIIGLAVTLTPEREPSSLNRRTHTNHRSNEMTISFERRREKNNCL